VRRTASEKVEIIRLVEGTDLRRGTRADHRSRAAAATVSADDADAVKASTWDAGATRTRAGYDIVGLAGLSSAVGMGECAATLC